MGYRDGSSKGTSKTHGRLTPWPPKLELSTSKNVETEFHLGKILDPLLGTSISQQSANLIQTGTTTPTEKRLSFRIAKLLEHP